ncbi:MAG TPA: GreA/GreB family elongation factor [Firmicutes bacterium]|jgi:transcription elongation factor GreA|nr:GreA/GreB family elongation factor [Bacillota bacterium]
MGKRDSAMEEQITKLKEHLARMKKDRDLIIERYFPEDSEDRDEFEDFFNKYLRGVEKALKSLAPGVPGKGFPLVVIGSEVNVEDLVDGDLFRFRIVLPFQGHNRIEDVTCLSPAGKALILKKPGEEVTVAAPAGTFRYRIKEISFSA